jgi:DNA invertase Pin-like site-specific DNA recombinase
MKVAIYARVSSKKQEYEMQLRDLHELALRNSWEPVEYLEKASGKSGRKRPVLEQLLTDAKARRFDIVLVWKIDRFGRSVRDFVQNVQVLDLAGVRFFSMTDGIDTDKRNPAATLLMHVMAAFAEFEATLIQERTAAGKAEYILDYDAGKIGKDRHSKSGKDLAPYRPRRIFARDRALELRVQNWSWGDIAAELGVPKSTIRSALAISPS